MIPSLPQVDISQVRIAPSSNLDSVRAALPVDAVLTVQIRQDPATGQRGIMVGGSFVPAAIPEPYKPGETLQVRVVGGSDAIILKILPTTPELSQFPAAAQLAADLRELFDENALLLIRSALRLPRDAGHGAPSTSAGNLPQTRPSNDGTSSGQLPRPGQTQGATRGQGDVAEILQRAIAHQPIVDSVALQQPTELAQKLAALTSLRPAMQSLSEAKTILRELAQQELPRSFHTTLSALHDTVTELIDSGETLSFEGAPPVPEGKTPTSTAKPSASLSTREQIHAYLAIANYLTDIGASHEDLLKAVQSPEQRSNPLVLLLLGMKSISTKTPDTYGSTEKTVFELLRGFAHELESLRDAKAPDKAIRDLLKRIHTDVKGILSRESHSADRPNSPHTALEAVRSLETLLRAQETLSQANGIFNSFGEPSFMVVPTLINGVASRWEITLPHHNEKPDRTDEDGKGSGGRTDGFEQIELNFSLPAFGEIGLRIAHRKGEVLAQATFSNKEAQAFIDAKLPTLTKRLAELGYEKSSLTTRLDEFLKHRARRSPEWVTELTARSVIA